MDVVMDTIKAETVVYPVVILSQTGEPIARINPDRTWSVKWNAVLDQAYQPLTDTNIAICAICKVLVAGRDNFRTSYWDTHQPWLNFQYIIGCASVSPVTNDAVLALVGPTQIVAYINPDGTWSIDWEQVKLIRTLPDGFWGLVALAGFCELLMGAKDNFHTSPMYFP
jgi:hypothetical protein